MGHKPFARPNFTPFDNYTLDVIMPALSPNGWKVLCVAIRQTAGWADATTASGRREWDQISYSQYREKAGIASDATVSRALKECIEAGYIIRRKVGHVTGTGAVTYTYSLNRDYEAPATEIEAGGPATETVVAPATETVVGPATETVETKERNKQQKKDVVVGLTEEQDKALDRLQALGWVPESSARTYALKHDAGAVLAWCNQAQARGLGVGWIRERLDAGDQPPGDGNGEDDRRRYIGEGIEWEGPIERVPETAEEKLWSEVIGDLKGQMAPETFDQWIRNTTLEELDAGRAVIGVQSANAQEWLEHRLSDLIERTLTRRLGEPVTLAYQVTNSGGGTED